MNQVILAFSQQRSERYLDRRCCPIPARRKNRAQGLVVLYLNSERRRRYFGQLVDHDHERRYLALVRELLELLCPEFRRMSLWISF